MPSIPQESVNHEFVIMFVIEIFVMQFQLFSNRAIIMNDTEYRDVTFSSLSSCFFYFVDIQTSLARSLTFASKEGCNRHDASFKKYCMNGEK